MHGFSITPPRNIIVCSYKQHPNTGNTLRIFGLTPKCKQHPSITNTSGKNYQQHPSGEKASTKCQKKTQLSETHCGCTEGAKDVINSCLRASLPVLGSG